MGRGLGLNGRGCAIDLDFDPKGRVRYALLVVLGILISICLGLIVMAPSLFPPKDPMPRLPPMSASAGRSVAGWVAQAFGMWTLAGLVLGGLIVEVAWVVVARVRNRKGGGR